AYGRARVVREPLGGDLRFDIRYHQVYTHNPDGMIAGTLHWSRYLGDRQFGWLGSRPVCDIALKLDAFAPLLPVMFRELSAMTARYRIGDGTGATYVGAAHNCAQDANQALFDALGEARPTPLSRALLRALEPWGHARDDWKARTASLGRTMEDAPWSGLLSGLKSWRTLLPRLASDTIAKIFLGAGADAFVMRTTQVGGVDPSIEPVVPLTL
ncbi:MAG: CAAX protease, partial [Candidatus Eremiobacteraeota bacterium]|nr:CAAX protease [Candidatus Eremiobacteraeota bacterium]